jgi:hypothetical protein
LERDREANVAEYLAQFRNDVAAFVSYEVVQACIGDHHEMAPLTHRHYFAFVDPSGGSADSFTLAISHTEGDGDDERIIIDAIREVRPPFSPEAVCDEFAVLLRTYHINLVRGDRYAGEWPREQFKKRDIGYVCSEKPKSDLYRDLLPLLNSGKITLPKSDRLVSQLTGLERRTARSGKDSIDHAPNSHDDLANAVAGAAQASVYRPAQVRWGYYGTFINTEEEKPSRLREEMRAQIPKCLIDFNPERNRERK